MAERERRRPPVHWSQYVANWPPFIDYEALLDQKLVSTRPSEIEKEILTAGEDFCGMMKASRLSMGLMLLWREKAMKDAFQESFWLHHTDTYLKLSVASDRLRKLVIVTCTGEPPRLFESKNRRYAAPYEKAGELLDQRGFRDERARPSMKALPELGRKLFAYIGRRNKIVHEIATKMARSVRENVSELQERYDQEQRQGFTLRSRDLLEWFPTMSDEEVESKREVNQAIEELCDWYAVLIEASNYAFQIEYWSRTIGSK